MAEGDENSSSKHGEDSDWPAFILGLFSHWCVIPGVAEGDENSSSKHGEDSDWPAFILGLSSHWCVIPGVAEGDENSSSKHGEDLQLLSIEVVALGGRPDVPRHLQVPKYGYLFQQTFLKCE